MKKDHVLFILFVSVVCFHGTSCEKDKVIHRNSTTASNLPPVAKAGIDITIAANSIFLDGSNSSDPDGTITGYAWSKISGPASCNFVNQYTALTQVTSLVEGVYLFELIVSDDKGANGSDMIQVTVLGPITPTSCTGRPIIDATLVPLGNLSQARTDMKCASAGNKILFAGGYSNGYPSSRVDIYDISSNSWSTANLRNDWFGIRSGITAASVGNKVFFAGGGELAFGDGSAIVDIYDAVFNTWSVAWLSVGRMFMGAVSTENKVFFAGGLYADGYLTNTYMTNSKVVDIYDNNSNTWTTALLSEGRHGLSATNSGNKIYFAGGTTILNNAVSNKIDVYDLLTDSWSTSNMQEPRALMGSVAAGNKIFWAAGFNSFPTTIASPNNNIEIRDLSTGTSSIACLDSRYYSSAVIRGDNIVFFTGDNGTPTGGTFFEIYNITTGAWSTGRLNQKIIDAAIISVNNNIYVAGGKVNNNYSNQVWKLEF